MNLDIDYKVIGVIVLLAVALGVGTFSFSNVSNEKEMNFLTSTEGSEYSRINDQISNGLKLYGEEVKVENHNVPVAEEGDPKPENPDTSVATARWGDEQKPVYYDTNSVEFKNGEIGIEQVDATRCTYIQSLGTECYQQEEISNIHWDFKLDIDKDQIQADVTEIKVEDVGQGRKKIDAKIKVENKFNPVETSRMYAEVFGKEIDLDTGLIEEGSQTYEVTTSKDFYDSSEFIRNEKVDTELTVFFEGAKIPDSEISGKPEMDGDWRTFESFEEGGSTPDIGEIKDGDQRYGAAEGYCDIQYMKQHGLDTRDCYGYSGGSDDPLSTQNHEITLENFRSESENVSTTVQYCGENATFSDGECVIDDELHLRGDLCPLLGDQQIVTRTFNEGDYSSGDLSPSPSFFCTKHPALVTESEGDQTDFTTEPYRKMVDGESFTVPEGQTYTLYWTTNIEENDIDTVCEQGSFNPETGDCEVTQGVVHQCSTGVWNPETGSCVVHPEVEPICEEGRYNSQTDTCTFEADSASECGTGSFENGVCYQQANVKKVCPNDANITDGVCQDDAVVLVQNSVLDSVRLLVDNIIGTVSEMVEGTFSTLVFWN